MRFSTKPRETLKLPMGLFDDSAKDPVFEIRYLTPARRQKILDSYAKVSFYPKPSAIHIKKLKFEELFEDETINYELAQLVKLQDIEIEAFKADLIKIVKNNLAKIPEEFPYIERREAGDNVAAMIEIIEAAVVNWEHIEDSETGKPIPYNNGVLHEWLCEGGELLGWFMDRLPEVFREFDTMLAAQHELAEKN